MAGMDGARPAVRADGLTECPVIVGTAGHVDHGKSSLIEALTGTNPDRLEVERRRGMTVELGFGELALPGGRLVGLVDVPGHAHYLRAMVAGATGIDVAVIAVSAVEGVMPQTREHVHVLELLGVGRAVVALTFADAADAEMRELAELDVEEFLSGTVFAGSPVVGVSSRTGEGLPALLAALDTAVDAFLADRAARPARHGLVPRLPADRSFTIAGAGTVVTGTLRDAPLSVGDELVAVGGGARFRVRGLQVHGDTPRALPGQRVAANLVGEGAGEVPRGVMLAAPAAATSTLRLAVNLTYLGREGARPAPLPSGTRVHVMLGTTAVLGRVMLYGGEGADADALVPGETRPVQIRLEEPLPARAHDRLIVLSYSPVTLIGGGEVLLSRCRRARELTGEARDLVRARAAGDEPRALAAWLAMQAAPVRAADACAALDLTAPEADALLAGLAREDAAVALGAGSGPDGAGKGLGPAGAEAFWVAPAVLDACVGALAAALSQMHADAPKKTGFTPGEVAHRAWPRAGEALAAALFSEAERRGACARETGEVFDPHSAAAAARLVAEAKGRIVAALDAAGLDAPTQGELREGLGMAADTFSRAVRDLALDRAVVRVERDVVISAAADAALRARVTDVIQNAGGAATTSELREALGVSRKRAIALLEHLDAVRFTVIDKDAGGVRRLRG